MFPPDNPAEEPSEAIKRLRKNLEEEPLVKQIKGIEAGLLARRKDSSGDYVFRDYTDAEDGDLRMLLGLFRELLATEYGALNYIINTMPDVIDALYDVNTSIDFSTDLDEVRVRIPNPVLDPAVVAGGGRRWFGEEARYAVVPEEDSRNEKVTDAAIEEIIESIEDMLGD